MIKYLLLHITKGLYRRKYEQLRSKLISEYKMIQADHANNYSTLSRLLISGEDHRFYYHIGFDCLAILRAIKNRVLYGRIEGASTIEQQLVRVLTNSFDRTLNRKIQEIFLSTTISTIVPKNEIPKIYLNVAYYGAGMKGLRQIYAKFQIDDKQSMSVETAAEIVSRIKYPQDCSKNLKQLRKIEMRKKHLLRLYNRHLNRKFLRIYE